MSKRTIIYTATIGTIFLITLALAACSTPTAAPTPTPDPCQVPENWENGGKFIQLRDTGGNVVGSLQLFLDEENGVLLLDEQEPVYFPPGSQGELKIGEIVTEFFFGCDGNFYFPPGVIQVSP